jgi:ABC-type transporter Mla MlaB component
MARRKSTTTADKTAPASRDGAAAAPAARRGGVAGAARKTTAAPALALGEQLVIGEVGTLHGQALEAFDAGAALRVDCSRVERADTAGVQLLVAMQREAARRGTALEWLDPTPALRDAVRCLALDDTLALPAPAA